MKLNNKGFTLVEVLAIVAIIAIIGTIATPGVLSAIKNSKEKSYQIMISNINTAAKALYEEVEYNTDSDEPLKKYSVDENQTQEQSQEEGQEQINSSDITIVNNSIEVNLQTLVSNGFLSGTCVEENNEGNENKCKKQLINPKTKTNIGACEIKITKTPEDGDIVKYTVTPNGTNNEDCPTQDDYSQGVN